MDQEVLKFLLSNASVAGVLSVCIWWLLKDRKTLQDNFDKERSALEKVIAQSLADVKELNLRSRDDQKSTMAFLKEFQDVIAKSDPHSSMKDIMDVLKKVGRKIGLDPRDLD